MKLLNISKSNDNLLEEKLHDCRSFNEVMNASFAYNISRFLVYFLIFAILFTFLPWTQNIRALGKLTTLLPQDRPQDVQSMIAGKIEKWYVREGDFVFEGDTIVEISEVKDDYFDPLLLERTELQIEAKESAINSYNAKITALSVQIRALETLRVLKLSQAKNKVEQAKLKVTSDSIDVVAADTALAVAKIQLKRSEALFKDGIKPRSDFEDKTNKFQVSQAKYIEAQNKLLISKADLINAQIELNSIENDFLEKRSKAESDLASAESMLFQSQAELLKLTNQFSNYQFRMGQHFVTAPQSGHIVKTIKAGIGEMIKELETVATIVPSDRELAVELYVRPVDIPLIKLNKKVRILFDGWPAIVFSGWPYASFGTFGGKVAAIDNNISPNGRFRILVKPDKDDEEWPEPLRVGGGAIGFLLLNDVPIWYEIWRQLNGFPPEYYQPDDSNVGNAKISKK